MYQPLNKASLADAVFKQLSERILSGRLRDGDRLPAERILAEQLGVNRGAVREGLKRLQQAALIEIRHGGATQVRDWRQQAGLELLPQLLLDDDGQINPEAARGIMQLRSALAPAVAAAAALQGSAALADELQACWTDLETAAHAADRQQAALEFWSVLVAGCGNIAFQLAFNSMRQTYGRIQDLLSQVLDVEFRDTASLAGIIQAIREQDPATAREHAASHVSTGEAAIEQLLRALPTNRSR